MVDPVAIKTALPYSAEPCAAPKDPAKEDSSDEPPRSKHASDEQTRLKASAVPLTFEQRRSAVDSERAEPFLSVNLTRLQDQNVLLILHATAFYARKAAAQLTR